MLKLGRKSKLGALELTESWQRRKCTIALPLAAATRVSTTVAVIFVKLILVTSCAVSLLAAFTYAVPAVFASFADAEIANTIGLPTNLYESKGHPAFKLLKFPPTTFHLNQK
jgi:hypothetical protein